MIMYVCVYVCVCVVLVVVVLGLDAGPEYSVVLWTPGPSTREAVSESVCACGG